MKRYGPAGFRQDAVRLWRENPRLFLGPLRTLANA